LIQYCQMIQHLYLQEDRYEKYLHYN
jgi:hypothetical protein